ncbi:citrate lyase holo-[acyl-carrier protein] synthase [Pseudenterobacter timonensis]|uniref:citrate lyase holo-[acyl-carrier protein] synthase n=1 Tax=Pseudenterobacter timonensis TaxID=1755099 RepID=UPI00077B7284|nr:citrate lyase holo-[acyl-carrier protein] synthase [Pseudenterobacter timonensis]
MQGADRLSDGQAVTLEALLNAREKRLSRQRHALTCYRLPLVSLTLVTPGPVKNNRTWRRLAANARKEVLRLCAVHSWACAWEQSVDAVSGPEWMAAICAPAKTLKRAMVHLEENHPLGRLWDIDIIDSDGRSLSRREFGFPPRRCLVCAEAAHICARARRHTIDMLLEEIARRIEDEK